MYCGEHSECPCFCCLCKLCTCLEDLDVAALETNPFVENQKPQVKDQSQTQAKANGQVGNDSQADSQLKSEHNSPEFEFFTSYI